MEYLPLGDVESHLMYEPRLREDVAKVVVRQTLAALKFMHEKALAHRGLKRAVSAIPGTYNNMCVYIC